MPITPGTICPFTLKSILIDKLLQTTSCDYHNTNTNSTPTFTKTEVLHHGNSSGSKLCQMQQPGAEKEQFSDNVWLKSMLPS